MEKKKFHITLITDNNKEEYNVLGLYDKDNNILTYKESKNLIIHTSFNLENNELTRETKDYLMKLKFLKKKETDNEVFLKELNKKIIIKIRTKKIIKSNNKIMIEYIVLDSNENKVYEIEY